MTRPKKSDDWTPQGLRLDLLSFSTSFPPAVWARLKRRLKHGPRMTRKQRGEYLLKLVREEVERR